MDQDETEDLLVRAATGDRTAVDALFARHRDRLVRMVRLRLQERLHDRCDASDVVQETLVEAVQRLPQFLTLRPMPFLPWLRFLTGQKLVQLHRRHFGAQQRDARVETRLDRVMPGVSTAGLSRQLLASVTSPSMAADRAEARLRLLQVLEQLEPLDREVLVLRHFEQLGNAEVAIELGIQESAASKRYLRALARLEQALAARPGGEPTS